MFVTLFLWGVYIMLIHPNLAKKLIGLYIVQTSVLFFLVAYSAKSGATVRLSPMHCTLPFGKIRMWYVSPPFTGTGVISPASSGRTAHPLLLPSLRRTLPPL